MRARLIITFFALIIVILCLMSIYIVQLLSDNLYETERSDMFAKANIISETVSSHWYDYSFSVIPKGNYNWLDDIVGGSLSGSNVRGILTDTSYTVIYDTNSESDLLGKILMRDTIQSAFSGEQAHTVMNSESGAQLLCVAVPITVDNSYTGVVYLTTSAEKINNTISSIRTSLLVFSLIICILVGLLSFAMSYAITSPLEGFIQVAKEISKGNFKKRMEVKGDSEIAQLSEAMNYMCAELEHFDERRRKFVSDASHELKTPMATIKLLCDSIVSTENPDIEMVKEFLNDLSDEVDRLTRIIESLLVLTKLDSSEDSLKPVMVDFGVMLKKIEKKLETIAVQRNITIHTEILTEDMQPIMVDYDKIWEAIYNIEDNAIKYSKIGSSIKVSAYIKGEHLIVEISDNGNGIPDEYKERIFERFYRLDDSRARDTGGTGLGLAIAKETVEMHGGKISVKDGENGGSIFIISLPYKIQSV